MAILDNLSVSNASTTTTLYTNSTSWYPYASYTPSYVPASVTFIEPEPAKPAKKAKETPEEWLRRRVDEMCWKPE